jgi:hypothetical protein
VLAALQALVVPASASASVVLQAAMLPALVSSFPVLALSLVSVMTVKQHILAEVVGPDRRSGLTGNLMEQLLVVASLSLALAVVF